MYRKYCGSETYSSPEVLSGRMYCRVKQEIFSLGVYICFLKFSAFTMYIFFLLIEHLTVATTALNNRNLLYYQSAPYDSHRWATRPNSKNLIVINSD